MNIIILTVGSLKEKWEKAAFDEYTKRISGYSAVNSVEIQETRLSDHPSEKEIANALDAEGRAILSRIPKNAAGRRPTLRQSYPRRSHPALFGKAELHPSVHGRGIELFL